MSKVALELNQFKHLKSDDKSTTLQHKDGHILTIAHDKIHPEMKSQLQALSKVSQAAETPLQSKESVKMANGGISHQKKAKYCAYCGGMAHSGECMADGGKVAEKARKPFEMPKPMPESGISHQPTENKLDYTNFKKENADKNKQYKREEMLDKARKSYAEGDEVTADPNQVTSQMPEQQYANIPAEAPRQSDPPDLNQVPPDLVEKRKIYDKIFATSPKGVQTMPERTGGLPTDSYFFDIKGNPQTPSNIDPDVWSQTEAMYTGQQQEKANKQQTQIQDMAKQNAARQAAGLAPLPPPTDMAISAPNSPADQTQEAIKQPNTPTDLTAQNTPPVNPMNGMEAGFNTQIAGLQNQANALSNEGKMNAAILNKDAENRQLALGAYQNTLNGLNREVAAHEQDIRDGYIDPNKYWTGYKAPNGEMVGGHSKVASAIGLILAGFNPTNNPNAAMNMLKYQMDQSMEAQKSNLNSQHNLLRANLEQFRNMRDAQDMTRIMMNDAASHQLMASAAKAQGPLAQAAAQQAIGPLQREKAMLMNRIGLNQTMLNLAQGKQGNGNPEDTGAAEHIINAMRVWDPEGAKTYSQTVVPHVGVATEPVEPAVRQQLIGHQVLRSGLQDLQNFVNSHSTKLGNPLDPDYVRGQQKVQKLQAAIRESVLGTVYREGEQPLLDKFLKGNPAGLLKDFVTKPQLQELIDSNNRDYNIKRQGAGMQPVPIQQAQQFKTVNGVKYMRGPKGEAIPVK